MSTRTKILAGDAALAKLEAVADTVHLRKPPTVGEIMTKDVATCRPGDTLDRCAQIMWDRACGCVPVVDDEGMPIAMVTDRDVCMAAYLQGKALSSIAVTTAMSKHLFTVGLLSSVAAAEAIMRRHCVRRLPVVDQAGHLVGVLSIDDITRRGHLGPALGRDGLSVHAVAGTAAAVGHGPPPPAEARARNK